MEEIICVCGGTLFKSSYQSWRNVSLSCLWFYYLNPCYHHQVFLLIALWIPMKVLKYWCWYWWKINQQALKYILRYHSITGKYQNQNFMCKTLGLGILPNFYNIFSKLYFDYCYFHLKTVSSYLSIPSWSDSHLFLCFKGREFPLKY